MANPIASVDGATVRCPSVYKYGLQDVSDPNAGRTEDILMHKNRVAQKVKLELEWWGLTDAEVSAVLQAFDPEYITVKYKDAKAGSYLTKVFYVGDRTAPMYNATLGLWENVKFNIVER